ncbi:MAG: SulP family inorganic anion transporter [Bdellovibrionales bacterium]|nr:SulP family inorganic anion transporter [Bdellovibrionales bacterium]
MSAKSLISSIKSTFPDDFPASIVVFLVATPLCLGIALASNAPLFSGIIAGIIGGIVVGAISGSALGVSGPAAGLAVIVYYAIGSLGGWENFLMAVVLAGFFQLALGFLRAGIIGYYFPNAVIRGMLAGIGLIIILKQLPHAVGYDEIPEGLFTFVQSDAHNTLSELFYMFNYIQPTAIVITLLCIFILIAWEKSSIKKLPFSRWVQGPLVAVIASIIVCSIIKVLQPSLALDASHLVQIPIFENFKGFLSLFTFPNLEALENVEVYKTALVLAVVASLETLLCVEATDKLDPDKRKTPTNLELKAQGIGNIVSGLIGGLPITQVIVRSSANIQSGARSKLSAIYHGFLLLFAVLFISTILNMIPLATLAAILIIVGYKLASPKTFKEMYSKGVDQFIPFLGTILGILFTDLLMGIGIGVVLSIGFILYKNIQHKPFSIEKQEDKNSNHYTVHLHHHVSFLNRASMMDALDRLDINKNIIIDATKTKHIDTDVVDAIKEFQSARSHRNGSVIVKGL